jgi:CRP-like cAMP-binding protein
VALFSQDTKVDALKRAPLFREFSKKELSALAQNSEDLDVQPGKVLCKEGETAHEFFVIVDGEVEISKDGRAIARRGAGDFFGEIALIERVPRTATVTAATPLRFFVLTGPAFAGVMDEHPDVERKVLRALAMRVAELSGDPANA